METADLRGYATFWGTLAEANREAMGDGWDLADDHLALHMVAASRLAESVRSSIAAGSLTASNEATLGLVCHGANVFTSVMLNTVRGLFDVSSLLLRSMLDIQSLTYACVSREEEARKFLAGNLEASECRRLLVSDLRAGGSSLADAIDSRFKQASWIANLLAHVKVFHTTKVLQISGNVFTPTAWGQHDPIEALEQTKAVLEYENWQLSWLTGFRKETLGDEWIAQFNAMRPRIEAFMAR